MESCLILKLTSLRKNDISGIAESRVQVRGYNPKYTDNFDEIKNINDEFTTIDSLGNGQVFINSALSEL